MRSILACLVSAIWLCGADYDRFWIVFGLRTAEGHPLFRDGDREAELIVRIYEREGRITWPIPASIQTRISTVLSVH